MASALVLAAWLAIPLATALVTAALEHRSDAQNSPPERPAGRD